LNNINNKIKNYFKMILIGGKKGKINILLKGEFSPPLISLFVLIINVKLTIYKM